MPAVPHLGRRHRSRVLARATEFRSSRREPTPAILAARLVRSEDHLRSAGRASPRGRTITRVACPILSCAQLCNLSPKAGRRDCGLQFQSRQVAPWKTATSMPYRHRALSGSTTPAFSLPAIPTGASSSTGYSSRDGDTCRNSDPTSSIRRVFVCCTTGSARWAVTKTNRNNAWGKCSIKSRRPRTATVP